MPTIPENELVCDAIEAKKPKSKRKSTSPRKVRIEYNKINLPNESFKAEIPEHCNIFIKQVSDKSRRGNQKAEKKKGSSRRASTQEVDTPNSKHI
jgi:hypothetical protein